MIGDFGEKERVRFLFLSHLQTKQITTSCLSSAQTGNEILWIAFDEGGRREAQTRSKWIASTIRNQHVHAASLARFESLRQTLVARRLRQRRILTGDTRALDIWKSLESRSVFTRLIRVSLEIPEQSGLTGELKVLVYKLLFHEFSFIDC